jgi:hypothetical protein
LRIISRFVEYDLALINADHSSQLVVEKLMPMVLDVLCESDPVADCQHDLLSLEHAELSRLVEWQLLFDAILSDDDSSLLPARDLSLFTALESLFLDSSANNGLGRSMKLDDCPGSYVTASRKNYCRSVLRELEQILFPPRLLSMKRF